MKKWRINYCVDYRNQSAAMLYRDLIHDVLINVAFLQGIECVIQCGIRFDGESDLSDCNSPTEVISDIVYFRSSQQTKIEIGNFRRLLDSIFEPYRFLDFSPLPIGVGAMMQKYLNKYPFPKSE